RSFFVLLFFLSVLFHSSLLRFLFFFLFLLPPPPPSTLFPYTTLFRSPENPSLLLRSSLLPPLAFSKCFYCIILDSEMSKKRIVLEENHTKSNGGQRTSAFGVQEQVVFKKNTTRRRSKALQ